MDNNTPHPDTVNETVVDESDVKDVKDIDESKDEASTEGVAKREKRKLSFYFTGSIIMSWLSLLTECIYSALLGGLFGKLFTAYSSVDASFKKGFLNTRIWGNRKIGGWMRQTRMIFAEGFENSFLLGISKKAKRILLESSIKNYGNFLLCFGLYTAFAFFIKRFVISFGSATLVDFLVGAVCVIVALPMITAKISLAEALGKSSCARLLLCEAFGMRDESFNFPMKQSRFKSNVFIVAGIASGILTLFVSPMYLLVALLVAVALVMIMSVPEIGIVVTLFSLPFLSFFEYPSLVLASVILVSTLGYVVKIVRGKRIIKFEAIDIAVLLFVAVVFFSGVFSAGGTSSLYEAILACSLVLVYFLIANMIRTKMWVNRCVLALVSSAGITAVIGVLEYFFGDIGTQWLDTTYFSDIPGRVVSLFDNSNVLAFYLVLIFPFALDVVFKGIRRREKFLAMFSATAIVLCTVFTWSRGAWIGLIASTIVYLLIRTRGVIKAFFVFVLSLPALSIVMPDNIVKRFMSIGDLSDSSTYYRVLTWRGSLNAIAESLFGGYGYGVSTFENVYPMYAIAGIEAAEHTHSLYLQLLFGTGIIGLLLFLLVVFLFAQKNLEFFTKNTDKEGIGVSAAAFAAIAGALVMGAFDNLWYNSRVMVLFWVVMGIACATVRISNELTERRQVNVECDNTSAYIDI